MSYGTDVEMDLTRNARNDHMPKSNEKHFTGVFYNQSVCIDLTYTAIKFIGFMATYIYNAYLTAPF